MVKCFGNKSIMTKGDEMTTEYNIFDGITLIFRDESDGNAAVCPSCPSGHIEIVYCRNGRIEYEANGRFFSLNKGDMAIMENTGEEFAVYASVDYQGVALIINPKVVPDNFGMYLDGVNVSLGKIRNKICRCKHYYLIRSNKRLEAAFAEIFYEMPQALKTGYYRLKALELFMLLSGISTECSEQHEQCRSREQAVLIKQVCDYIREHIHIRLTIDELAKQFHISPSQLKKCFMCVCGKPVYSYIRSFKMELAASDLKETELSIIEIAAAYGYENSSKFASAFKAVMGQSPSEYRKKARGQNVFLD